MLVYEGERRGLPQRLFQILASYMGAKQFTSDLGRWPGSRTGWIRRAFGTVDL